jgi:hypothetical protein
MKKTEIEISSFEITFDKLGYSEKKGPYVEYEKIFRKDHLYVGYRPIPRFNGKTIREIIGNISSSFDLKKFIQSIHQDGNYFFFTCECGDPGCGGWFKEIRVVSENKNINWLIENYKECKDIGVLVFIFNRELYDHQIILLKKKLREIVRENKNLKIFFNGAYGYTLSDIGKELK